jgi:two-component sensor histidine kinase
MSKSGSPHQVCRQQQAALVAFGQLALSAEDLDHLLQEASRHAAEGLGIKRAKVLELLPGGQELLIRAGVGWEPGVVGHVILSAEPTSPAGYALHTSTPVTTPDLDKEERFQSTEVLRAHGIKSMVNVLIPGVDRPFGVLEVDSTKRRHFTEEDINFLHGYAILLSAALRRLAITRQYQDEAAHKTMLLGELEHRVRNNLQVIASLLNMQARQARSVETQHHLQQIRQRIEAVRLVHEKLHQTDGPEGLQLDSYLRELCTTLLSLHGTQGEGIHLDVQLAPLVLGPDRALPLGLIVNEFVTNSLKHAFPTGQGTLSLVLEPLDAGRARLVIADNGVGMPATDTEPASPPAARSGLGLKIIPMLAGQMQASCEWQTTSGTQLILTFPIPIE